ncbi:MAG: CPBP family intramembrane metalloprotease [Saprospirales bacterium]|nr:MAG: CPBP family intramembrane metalloprotease [Saprospirales bacterium]
MSKIVIKKGFFEAVFKGQTAFWSFIGVFLLVVLGYIVGQIPLTVAVLVKGMIAGAEGEVIDFDQLQQGDLSVLGLDLNLTLLLLLLSFVGAMAGLAFGIQWLNKRSWRTLVNYHGTFCWKKIGFGFGFWLILGLLVESFSLISSWDDYVFRFSFFSFFFLLVIALTLLPIQTSFEELFFRGWLMQKFGYYLNSKLIALVLSTFCFAAVHYMNPEVHKYGLGPMMIYYAQAGLLLGIITILDDSLELALGAHFATNFFGAVLINYEAGALQTYSLFKNTATLDVSTVNIGFFFISIIFIAVCYKKYNWKFSKLFDPIQRPEQDLLVINNSEE